MNFPQEQINELKDLFPNIQACDEGGVTFFLIPELDLPESCTPIKVDALLCATPRDGYESRLFFSQIVQTPKQLNWNANGVRILERNWHAFSWKTPPSLRLSQMVAIHWKGLM